MILIVTANRILGECIERACKKHKTKVLGDVFEAVEQIDDLHPDLIFLDLLLTGPDGFTFLNEIASYPETSEIPVVAISDLDLSQYDLSIYNIVEKLQKDTMTPEMIKGIVRKYAENDAESLKTLRKP